LRNLASDIASILGTFKDERIVEPLIDALKRLDWLPKTLQYWNEIHKIKVIWALGKTKDTRAFLPLCTMLNSNHTLIICWTIKAIARLGTSDAPGVILKYVDDPNENVRAAVAWALGELNKNEYQPQIIKLVKDDKSIVRAEGVYALARIGSIQYIDLIKNTLTDEDAYVRQWTVRALLKLKHASIYNDLSKLLHNEHDSLVKGDILFSFGELGCKDAVDILLSYINDKHPYIRANALIAIGKLGDKRMIQNIERDVNDTSTVFLWDGDLECQRKLIVEIIDDTITILNSKEN
jgi:HEAT repeat protein